MTAKTAVSRVRETGIDGVIVARGAIGNPWIFPEIRALWNGEPAPPGPSLTEQGQIMLEHFEMIRTWRPERKAIPYFRKFMAHYCKRHPDRKKTMLALMGCKTAPAVIETIKTCYCLQASSMNQTTAS